MTANSSPTVLIADDEHQLAELYAAWLEPDYTVKTANDGQEALDLLDDTVDVALLDRQMPKLNGDEVIDQIHDQNLQCRTAMITAVDPDFDILDLPCDEYLTKPVTRDELRGTVDHLLRKANYDEQIQRYLTLVSKKATLETEKTADELASSQDYQELIEEANQLKEELDVTLAEFDDADYAGLFRDLETRQTPPSTDEDS